MTKEEQISKLEKMIDRAHCSETMKGAIEKKIELLKGKKIVRK